MAKAFREAVVTMLAALATLGCAMALDPEPGPGVLAVVLCLSFSRSHLERDLRGRLEAAVALPLVGLLATGVGMLLLHRPWWGAAAFVAGMFASIWLRRFGPPLRRAGSLLALPFVAILTTPYIPTHRAGPIMVALMPIIVGLLALGWVALLQALARKLSWLAPLRAPATKPAPPLATGTRESTLRPIASTRMAIQMAVALAAAFVVGYVFFAERWAWIVLTAFIVNSGNRGRLDVAYKSMLRVLGAAVGTVLALTLALHAGGRDTTTVALILAAIFLGIWLRPLGYAWWALFVTLALALLQGFEGAGAHGVLELRLEEILIGAAIGVLAAWLVLPIRSIDVLRRRMADALAALAEALDPGTETRTAAGFNDAIDGIHEIAPAFRALRLATRRFRSPQPADWIEALSHCHAPAIALIERGGTPVKARRAVGAARKALRDPEELLPALRALRGELTVETPAAPRRQLEY